jgi:hydroxyethylthiazole kinase-like uncharacterized protein yjeF
VLTVAATKGGEPSPACLPDLADLIEKADAVVVGPGMMDEAFAAELAVGLARAKGAAAMLVDAAALTGLKGREGELTPAAAGRLVLTPHAGEMAALTGLSKEEVQADPERIARAVAAAWSATVALKGPTTFVATPEGRLWRHDGGVSGLGVSGSGDVLAGAIAGLMARGASPVAATLWGVFAHASAGAALGRSVAPLGFLAREVADALPRALYG